MISGMFGTPPWEINTLVIATVGVVSVELRDFSVALGRGAGGGGGGGAGLAQGLGGWLCQPVAAPIGLSPLHLLL